MKKEKRSDMKMDLAKRLDGIGEYYFSRKLKEIEEMNRSGEPVLNLGIGSPDQPPHPSVVETLAAESVKPNVHAYQSYRGSDTLRKAFAAWYQRSYGVKLDPSKEVFPLMGSKEGILHICMTYLNEGDEALVPNPGYPTYRSAVELSGGRCREYALTESNNWQIDLDALAKADLSRVKLMWVNYPHMPTGTLARPGLFQELVDFGKKHGILICHDNPYSFILNDHPASILSAAGAMDTALELNSLSKSHNMAGWRVGVLCGSADRIDEVIRFKSNMDSGMFLPLQLAAARALSLGDDWYRTVNQTYRQRRSIAFELLDLLGLQYSENQVGMFLWAKVPQGNGYELSDRVLQAARVFITPGAIFGSEGENFIRVSLCSPEEKFKLAIERIKKAVK